MLTLVRTLIAAYKTAAFTRDHDELHRDEFERHAFASGDFKGVRFTRLKDGAYADARLEFAWHEWVADEEWADRQI